MPPTCTPISNQYLDPPIAHTPGPTCTPISNQHLNPPISHAPYMHSHQLQWSPFITDTTGTKDFIFYSKVSFAQGVIVDHCAPLAIVASYTGARLWTMHEISYIDERSVDL